jgi:hypothetical protein
MHCFWIPPYPSTFSYILGNTHSMLSGQCLREGEKNLAHRPCPRFLLTMRTCAAMPPFCPSPHAPRFVSCRTATVLCSGRPLATVICRHACVGTGSQRLVVLSAPTCVMRPWCPDGHVPVLLVQILFKYPHLWTLPFGTGPGVVISRSIAV